MRARAAAVEHAATLPVVTAGAWRRERRAGRHDHGNAYMSDDIRREPTFLKPTPGRPMRDRAPCARRNLAGDGKRFPRFTLVS